jgi:hypothetical protein
MNIGFVTLIPLKTVYADAANGAINTFDDGQNITKETSRNGQSAAIVILDKDKFKQYFDLMDKLQHMATVEIKGDDPTVIVYLPSDVLMDELSKHADGAVTIKHDGITYSFPLAVLKDSPIHSVISVTLIKVTGYPEDAINTAAQKEGAKVLLPHPINFVLTINGEEVTDFNGIYADRTISIGSVADPNKVTAVWLDSKNQLRFVPSTVINKNGESLVTIHSPHNSVYTLIQSNKTFNDLQGQGAKTEIEYLANKSIVKGISEHEFDPDNGITRAEFVSMLTNALGLAEVKVKKRQRSMMPKGKLEWFKGAVDLAIKAKLIPDNGMDAFRPNERITREEMALMIANALKFGGKKLDSDITILNKFKDRDEIADWAKEAAAQTLNLNLIASSTSDTFSPKENATRAQAATMIIRMLQALHFVN